MDIKELEHYMLTEMPKVHSSNELIDVILSKSPLLIYELNNYLSESNINYIKKNNFKYEIPSYRSPLRNQDIAILKKCSLKLKDGPSNDVFNILFLDDNNSRYETLKIEESQYIGIELKTILKSMDKSFDINLYPRMLDLLSLHQINNRAPYLFDNLHVLSNTSIIDYYFSCYKLLFTNIPNIELFESNKQYFKYSDKIKWKSTDYIDSIDKINFMIDNDPFLNKNYVQYYNAIINDSTLRLYFLDRMKQYIDIRDLVIDLNLFRLSKITNFEPVFGKEFVEHIISLHNVSKVLGHNKEALLNAIRSYQNMEVKDITLDI